MNIPIYSTEDLERVLIKSTKSHYVYVLCEHTHNDNKPFYVGIGQGKRIFSHEEDAKNTQDNSNKLNKIREIWERGDDVIRFIDSFHDKAPYVRETILINKWGLLKDGSGILTNEQSYKDSKIIDSVELRKYAEYGNNIPKNFIRRNVKLMIGSRKPKNKDSVYGKIFESLAKNTGVTGEELVNLLSSTDFSSIESVYTQTGQVSIPWLCKYIDGGFYKKNLYIQEYDD